MKTITTSIFLSLLLSTISAQTFAGNSCPDLLQYQHPKLRSEESIDFCKAFNGKVLLVVNTASQCGYTKQFSGLQKLYEQYREQGLAVIGFPSDDFRQEFNSEEEIAKVCYVNYGVSFPMLSESSVTSANANSFFQGLKRQGAPAPNWNFNKFLIDQNGRFIAHYPSSVKPGSAAIKNDIERLLNAQ